MAGTLAFTDASQEQRFRAYFGIKRYWLDLACGLLPLTVFSALNSSRYLEMRACCEQPPCQAFVEQNPWMSAFPCSAPQHVFGWFVRNVHHVQYDFWMRLEFLDIGCVMALHYVLLALVLLGRQSWCGGHRRTRYIIFMRLAQKLVNVVAVFTTAPESKPSFMDVHYGPGTLHGATVLLWHSQLIALPLSDSAWLIPFEVATLSTVILARNRSSATPAFIAEVLFKQLAVGVAAAFATLYSFERLQRASFLRLEAMGIDPPSYLLDPPTVAARLRHAAKLGEPATAIAGFAKAGGPATADAGAQALASGAQHDAPPAAPALAPAAAADPRNAVTAALGAPQSIAAFNDGAAVVAGAGGLRKRRNAPGLYVPYGTLKLVSIKINNPPAGAHDNPAPLTAAVNAALRGALPPSLRLATRCAVIRGCLHLLVWVQAFDPALGPPSCPHPPSLKDPKHPADDACDGWQAGVAERVLGAVQEGLADAASPEMQLGITVNAYGQAVAASGAVAQAEGAGCEDMGVPGCWVVGGRVTLPCEGAEEGGEEGGDAAAVVALLPGGWQEGALVAAGGRARAVLVGVGGGGVLLDEVVELGGAELAGGPADAWLADAGAKLLRVPLGKAPALPAGSAAYLILLPHGDRSGHVLCSIPLLAAPPAVAAELQSYHVDATHHLYQPPPVPACKPAPATAADTDAVAPAGPSDLPLARDQAAALAAAHCSAFNESLLGLVWDMLSCIAPATPLHGRPSPASPSSPTFPPIPTSAPPAADCTPEEVAEGLFEFLRTQHLPATAAYLQQHSAVPRTDISAVLDTPPTPPLAEGKPGATTAAKLCLALPAIDMAASTVQLAVVVVCYAQQQYSARILLYYLLLLSLYVASLGPFWHFWRCRNLTTLPLLLRMAAAAPYMFGWVPLHSFSSSAGHRLLLLLLLNGAMHTVYARYGHPNGKQPAGKQHASKSHASSPATARSEVVGCGKLADEDEALVGTHKSGRHKA